MKHDSSGDAPEKATHEKRIVQCPLCHEDHEQTRRIGNNVWHPSKHDCPKATNTNSTVKGAGNEK